MRTLLQMVTILSLPLVLSSCAVYSTGFSCPDSLGAKCVMLSQVDQMVDSGEIETVYKAKICKNVKCRETLNMPQTVLSKTYKVKLESTKDKILEQHEIEPPIQEGEYLYIR